jgi:hypothetical protein
MLKLIRAFFAFIGIILLTVISPIILIMAIWNDFDLFYVKCLGISFISGYFILLLMVKVFKT